MAIKRLNYFDHQFLVAGDFTAEQAYHLEMRRRLNRLLYTEGIADGLEVRKSADKKVTVSPGVAIDRLGREMIWEPEPAQRVVDVSDIPGPALVVIVMEYREKESDPTTVTVPGNTRVTEQPVVRPVKIPFSDPSFTGVGLCVFSLDASGKVQGNVDDLLSPAQRVRPHNEQGLASINGVSHPGGDVELVEGAGISISPNQSNHSIAIATQGLLLASDYDLRRRALVTAPLFTAENADGAEQTVPIGFQPSVVLVIGSCHATMSGSDYGVGVSAFSFGFEQVCFSFSVTRSSPTVWRSSSSITLPGAICFCSFTNLERVPPEGETIALTMFPKSETEVGLKLQRVLNRLGNPNITRLSAFTIRLHLFCMG